jgi:hypothetical protein
MSSESSIGSQSQEKGEKNRLSSAAPDRVVFVVLFVLLESGFKRVSENV